jgi:hydrocephalus-inducing protein
LIIVVVANDLAFSVQPESWEIPPHEHRFVNIFFNPTEIKSYRSLFVAEVDDNSTNVPPEDKKRNENRGRILQFHVGGSGTLPCVTVEQPSERGEEMYTLTRYEHSNRIEHMK